MSDKKYPYIGRSELGIIALVYSEGKSICMSGNYQGERSYMYNEAGVKNITREYLSNTYGKCESQEHADFICKLAENYGFSFPYRIFTNPRFFSFSCKALIFFEIESAARTDGEKLIHLPLPPKEKPMEETKPVYTKEMR